MDSKVQVLESSFVAPSEPAPVKGQGLWLSSLDLKNANMGRTPIFYLYSSNHAAAPDFFDVPRLKEALAKALAVFYPLSGRLRVDKDGRMEISCNDEGALFVVARADLTIDDIQNMEPSRELRSIVVPRVDQESIISAVQVTFLKCGGVALGTTIHKVCVDGTSGFHFMQTWSSFSKHGDRATMELPSHDRTLLRARSPPIPHPDALVTAFYNKGPFSDPLDSAATKFFTISKDQVAFLKHICGGTSTFCAVSALVWKWTCIARRLPSDTEAQLTFAANFRRRVRPPLPSHYFGNAVVRLGITSTMQDISMEALRSVASRIKGAIDQMDDELVRSVVDYYEMAEMNRRPPRGTSPQTHLHIISWFGMPVYEADFGWGKPQVISRAESIHPGLVHLMKNEGTGDDEGGVRVVVCLDAASLMELERLLYAELHALQDGYQPTGAF